MKPKHDAHTLLEEAVQETRYRERTYNHEITFVRGAIEHRLGRILAVSVAVAVVLTTACILLSL